jgi:hypothetical protein
LASLTPLSWSRVYFFEPYSSHEHIQERLGFAWDGVIFTTVGWSEGDTLVVFAEDEQVVEWFEYSRGKCDLVFLRNARGYSPAEARFRVHSVGGRLELRELGE